MAIKSFGLYAKLNESDSFWTCLIIENRLCNAVDDGYQVAYKDMLLAAVPPQYSGLFEYHVRELSGGDMVTIEALSSEGKVHILDESKRMTSESLSSYTSRMSAKFPWFNTEQV